ncbi:hypothetical protein ACWDWO_00030 [Actinopolymorpha singaporensis]
MGVTLGHPGAEPEPRWERWWSRAGVPYVPSIWEFPYAEPAP